ncbi:MAG: DUF4281 domain-containing protein [Rhizobacter sp.]|nr:DUF4281 domain-containing protein [Chlorobiales bacterium]
MTIEVLFSICNLLALAGWALLIFVPKWKGTTVIARSGLVPLLLATVYLVLIVVHFGRTEGGFGSLSEVAKLFRNENLLLAGWVHYLAFDLFIGGWESADAEKHGVPHLAVVPCLVLTFLFGPVGLLCYFAVRTAVTKKLFN